MNERVFSPPVNSGFNQSLRKERMKKRIVAGEFLTVVLPSSSEGRLSKKFSFLVSYLVCPIVHWSISLSADGIPFLKDVSLYRLVMIRYSRANNELLESISFLLLGRVAYFIAAQSYPSF